jgi:hypothetical protein
MHKHEDKYRELTIDAQKRRWQLKQDRLKQTMERLQAQHDKSPEIPFQTYDEDYYTVEPDRYLMQYGVNQMPHRPIPVLFPPLTVEQMYQPGIQVEEPGDSSIGIISDIIIPILTDVFHLLTSWTGLGTLLGIAGGIRLLSRPDEMQGVETWIHQFHGAWQRVGRIADELLYDPVQLQAERTASAAERRQMEHAIQAAEGISPFSGPEHQLDMDEKLDMNEKRLVKRIVDSFKLDIDLSSKEEEEYVRQYEVVLGQFQAGNNNPQIKAKLKQYIMESMESGMLPRRECFKLLFELANS